MSSFDYDYFKPCATGLQDTGVVILKLEEMERRKDHLGMDQCEAADLMRVSQPTVHRILSETRRKIGCAMVCGKAIQIHGETHEMAMTQQRKFQCCDCQHVWEMVHGTERSQNCPNVKAWTCAGQRTIAAMPEPEVADMVYSEMVKSWKKPKSVWLRKNA